MWVARYAWLEIGVGGQICVVVQVWKVRYAWFEIGVGGQICVVGNRGGRSDMRVWK